MKIKPLEAAAKNMKTRSEALRSAVQKHVNLVDLVKSVPMNIFLQNLASIQPIASLSKFV